MSRSDAGALRGAVARRDSAVRTARWRLRNWPLRTKLIAVLLIPTLTALALIGLRFATDVRSAQRLAELSARVHADSSVARLVHALQRERDLTVRYVARGREGAADMLSTQRERVDSRLGEFSKTLNAEKPNLSPGSIAALRELESSLKVLGGLRYTSEHTAYPPDAVLTSYGESISGLLAAREEAVAEISEPELVRLQMAGTALARVKDQMSVTRALIAEALATGRLGTDRKGRLNDANSELEVYLDDFRKFATPDQQRMYDDTITGLIVDDRNDVAESVLVRAENGRSFDGLKQERWDTSATYTINLAAQVEDALLAVMHERTGALAEQARGSALRDAAIVLGLLLLATVLTAIIARSLLRPLRTLRASALRVADYQLPAFVHGILADPRSGHDVRIDPVPVYSREELGQVARAFDAVHGEAVRLAIEQATLRENVYTMFVNLALRGQDLYERQLAVLDRMESEESDPDNLARLFELDHLATRGRRICENLLVLSGNHSGRMLPGSVAASDVLGAALSEIEYYQRVRLSVVPVVGVRGDVVSDVVHVISELLENATAGATHDIMVSVVSSVTERGDLRVDITDNGPGMSPEAIEDANQRLSEPPVVDIEVARRMGLYVVARLAQRNGLRVRLSQASSGGLTASVLVPEELIGELPAGSGQDALGERARMPERLDAVRARQRRGPTGPLTAGPPKRAPVVDDAKRLAPRVVEPHPLDDEQPTESMPVYRELLTRWFDQKHDLEAQRELDLPLDPEPPYDPVHPPYPIDEGLDTGQVPGGAPAASVEPVPEMLDMDPPTLRSTRSLDAAIGVNSIHENVPEVGDFPAPLRGDLELLDGYSEAAGQNRHSGTNTQLEADKHDSFRDPDEVARRGSPEPISREPEAVKRRMISLVDGARRGRQARAGEYADRGRAATVGAGPSGWPKEREKPGGKER